ncbi:DNA polymerase epsilon subunit C [Debaryomyces fabryi]|uniref:DNA polymerase epsilon subunit C n=1 Tax=Debaryomyces fabryi TaxID=58627 RepID=A0A0V1Q637_9ASCO|nr:DNA polymerase epsilon subunit C [Debaryomyces fabryi]KSA03917.1 DNA polymerase epsilon subunit C [Debaryomyces fabryi]CUM48826.1 unnamed protein product [Debaryomyces fabryi]
MSSPIPPSSLNNSQVANIVDESNETPSTTPPMISNTATPVPEVEMEDANAPQDNNGITGNTTDAEKIQEGHEVDDEEDEEEEEESLSLPLSKIKRIFKMDSDYLAASLSAVYATGLATELFIQYFTEQALVLAKMDKRKKLQYKDFSNAVASQDSLNFLSDTVPKTQPIGELINNKKVNVDSHKSNEIRETANTETEEIEVDEANHDMKKSKPLAKGQQTLNFSNMNTTTENTNPMPIKKSVISDIVTSDNETEVTSKEATVDAEDQDVIMIN